MKIKQSVIKKAIEITSNFEGGYTALAGNTDGQFLSMGFLCWNFGQGTLQPMLERLFDEYPQVAADNLIAKGIWLHEALTMGYEREWAMQIQEDNIIMDIWQVAFNNLCNTPEFRKIQDDAAQPYLDRAEIMCRDWQLETDRAFCLAFDICVQNGGLKYYPMAETNYLDKLRSWVEVAVARSDDRWKYVVRQRKEAILNGGGVVYGGMMTFEFDDLTMYEEEAKPINWQEEYNKLKITLDTKYNTLNGDYQALVKTHEELTALVEGFVTNYNKGKVG